MSFLLTPSRRIASSPCLSRSFSTTRPSQVARMTMVGRIGAEPEISESAKGKQVVRYSVATSYGPKDNRQTSWFRVASFVPEGSMRDYVMGLEKGTLVYLEGDATMRSFEDKEGRSQSALSLVQTRLEVLKRPVPKTEGDAEES